MREERCCSNAIGFFSSLGVFTNGENFSFYSQEWSVGKEYWYGHSYMVMGVRYGYSYLSSIPFITLPLECPIIQDSCLVKTLLEKNPMGKKILVKEKEYMIIV